MRPIVKRQLQFLVMLMVIIGLLANPFAANHAAAYTRAQTSDPAQVLLQKMTPEERVGQLFLISFTGADLTQNAKLIELIQKKHIGGVIISAVNNNLAAEPETFEKLQGLTTALQATEFEGTKRNLEDPVSGSFFTPQYVPLFTVISQEGDMAPTDQILTGLAPLPSAMAIGATWNTDLAKKAGQQLGEELSATGINMLLGPDLDVLDILQIESGDDLGTRSFGSSPFWVGAMGGSFISGLHQGSNQRVAAIVKHFPGRGSSDRSPVEEVATVKKPFEQLQAQDLQPFLSVMSNQIDALALTDGLLIPHIRYDGLQGTVNAATKPVSLDAKALDQLLSSPAAYQWRSRGLILSDKLGSQAVRKYYDPVLQRFDARQVARDAFLAGNDLLYLDNFVATGDADQNMTVIKTIDYFAQKYREDAVFARRVDESVLRILRLKLQLYPGLNYQQVLPAGDLDKDGIASNDVSFSILQSAVTLISPGAAELSLALPQPPKINDRIVFITDSETYKQCSQCPVQPVIAINAFQNSVIKLYGPAASGQVTEYRLASYTMQELLDFLNNKDTLGKIENDLRDANWIVFSMLRPVYTGAENNALHRFLSERPEFQQGKKLIGFSFTAPYYLDATDISKLTAYYAFYSKIPAAIEVATRVLFQELMPRGRPPVSVPGIGYDLNEMMKPDPRQVIQLSLDLENYRNMLLTPVALGNNDPSPQTEIPTFDVGDNIPVITGIIVDRNQQPVADGTRVKFSFVTTGDTENVQQVDATTTDGVASAVYRITNRGVLEIKVAAEPAMVSQILRLNIIGGVQAAITVIAPTQIATAVPESSPTAIQPGPTAIAKVIVPVKMKPTRFDWLLTMLLIVLLGMGFFFLGNRIHHMRWGVRWGLLSIIGGITAYITILMGVFGVEIWAAAGGASSVFAFILLGSVLGWFIGYLWQSLAS